MPIHLEEIDLVAETRGLRSALIVPCNMCAAVTVAVQESKPFLELFRSFLKSPPFHRYLGSLRYRLREVGVQTELFKCNIPHQWFLCMCPSGRRRKLARQASRHDAVIVLGCDSATETVRDAVRELDCRVIQGMEIKGITNARPRLSWPANLHFDSCETVRVPPAGQ